MGNGADAAALAPLVDPAAELTRDEVERYSRHLLMPEVGRVGQRRLKGARVLVIGAGGLGAPVLMYLAAAGVGTVGIVDFDVVELSNLQRQVIHRQADVGTSKVRSAVASVAEINPLVTTVAHEQRLSSDNALEIFADYDLVLDGTDNFATRYLVNDACALLGKPYVWGSILRFEGQVSVFWATHGPTYRDVYPTPPPAGSVPSCAEGGVFGALCASIGSVMATEAIKLICGIGRSLLGRLLVYDALEMSYRTVTLAPDPDAGPLTELVDYPAFCGVPVSGSAAASHTVSPARLRERLAGGEDVLLVDVREPAEHEIVSIPGDVLIPRAQILSGAALPALPRDRPIVLYCRSGGRSAECLAALRAAGFADVAHLDGGVLAWAEQVAPAMPRY